VVTDSDEAESDDASNGNSGDEASLMTYETDDEIISMAGRLDPILLELESGSDADLVSDLLAARLPFSSNEEHNANVADSESESELASKEGSHNPGCLTIEAHGESRNKSEESDIESSEASFVTPPDIEEENDNNATEWCDDEDGNERIEEFQGVPSNRHEEHHDIENAEITRLQLLLRIEYLEKKKERGQADGDDHFPEKLAEADSRLLRNRKNLRIVDWEALFQARGENCPRASGREKKKCILNQWDEVVKKLPVIWEPWTEADDDELD
jgi:hypothetical protein